MQINPESAKLESPIDISCDIAPGCRAAPDGLRLTEAYRG
jgi:hypothetical protein